MLLPILVTFIPVAIYFESTPDGPRAFAVDLPNYDPYFENTLRPTSSSIPFPESIPYSEPVNIDIGSYLNWPGGVMDLWKPVAGESYRSSRPIVVPPVEPDPWTQGQSAPGPPGAGPQAPPPTNTGGGPGAVTSMLASWGAQGYSGGAGISPNGILPPPLSQPSIDPSELASPAPFAFTFPSTATNLADQPVPRAAATGEIPVESVSPSSPSATPIQIQTGTLGTIVDPPVSVVIPLLSRPPSLNQPGFALVLVPSGLVSGALGISGPPVTFAIVSTSATTSSNLVLAFGEAPLILSAAAAPEPSYGLIMALAFTIVLLSTRTVLVGQALSPARFDLARAGETACPTNAERATRSRPW